MGNVGVERVEAESLPPRAGAGVERRDDYGAAGSFLVQLNGRREDVRRERGADPEVGVAPVDREAAEQQCGDRIGRAFLRMDRALCVRGARRTERAARWCV